MRKLLTLLALTVLAANGALAQSGNNGARVGKNGFLLNVIAFERCPAATSSTRIATDRRKG